MLFRLCLALGLLSIRVQAAELEENKNVEFQIRDPKSKEVVFVGREEAQLGPGGASRQTLYFDLGKAEIYREEALYDLDSLRLLDYKALNHLTGEETLLKSTGEQVRVSYRPDKVTQNREETLSWGKSGFHTKVISQLITRHWSDLLSNKPLRFDLLLPFRFESLGFQIVHHQRFKVGSEVRESFLLQPQNFLIRAFVPRMEFQFAVAPQPRLATYVGPIPLPVQGQTNKTMEMQFSYPDS